jgi:hypothetical protein
VLLQARGSSSQDMHLINVELLVRRKQLERRGRCRDIACSHEGMDTRLNSDGAVGLLSTSGGWSQLGVGARWSCAQQIWLLVCQRSMLHHSTT